MRRFIKNPLIIILLIIVFYAVIWLGYLSAGRAVIKSAYFGKSLPFFNKAISSQAEHSLEYYYNKVERNLTWIAILVFLTLIFSIPMIKFLQAWSKGRQKISPKKIYWLASIVLLLWFSGSALFFQPAAHRFDTDFWEHSATIKEWSSNLWNPSHPHLVLEAPSRHFMPHLFLLSFLAKIFHLNPIQTLGLGAILNALLFLIGIYLFFRIFFKDEWAPFFALIILLTTWGLSYPWSSVYHLRSLFFIISYPSVFVFALALISLWVAKKTMRQNAPSFWALVSLGILTFIMFLSHPLTGAFAIASLVILVLFEARIFLKVRALLLVSIIAGLVLTELWPFLSISKLILSYFHGPGKRAFYSRYFLELRKILLLLGPMLAGIPVLIHLLLKKRHFFITVGFAVMTIPYVAKHFFPVPYGNRSVPFIVFFLHLALLLAVLNAKTSENTAHLKLSGLRVRNVMLLGLIGLSFGWNVTLSVLEFTGYHVNLYLEPPKRYSAIHPVVEDMKEISRFIPEEAVVLAKPELSWPLPTFSGRVVSILHESALVPDDSQRFSDSTNFFKAETNDKERERILRHYNVTHVLYIESKTPHPVIGNLNLIGKEIGRVKDYRIVRLNN